MLHISNLRECSYKRWLTSVTTFTFFSDKLHLLSHTFSSSSSNHPPPPPPQLLKHTLYAYLCMSPKVFSSFKIFSSAPPGSDMCINPIQSLQSPLLVPLWALSPRSWGSGHTWCSWTLQRFAWQRWWCRSPRPTARCSRGRKMRPNHRWHTGNIECCKEWENGKRKLGVTRGINILNRDYSPRNPKGCHSNDGNAEIDHSHVGEGDVVLKVTGKVSLDESLCLGECLVSTSAEEGNAGETQQRGYQGAVRHPTQTAHTAVIATCSTKCSTMKVRLQK